MDNAHHVDTHRAVKPELLRNAGHLIGRQHDAKSQQHITGEGQKPQKQQAGLHERR